MIRWVLSIAAMVAAVLLQAQSATVSDIKIIPKGEDTATVKYPVISLANAAAAQKINAAIKKAVIDDNNFRHPIADTRLALKKYASGQRPTLTDLDYAVTFNKNGILSLTVYVSVWAAYPNNFQRYFNFNLNTGESIPLESVIKPGSLGAFKTAMLSAKQTGLNDYFKEIKSQLDSNEITKDDYDYYQGIVKNNCMDSIATESFSLSAGYIQVYDDCEFPHAVRAEQPYLEIKLDIKTNGNLFDKAFLQKLLR